MTSVYAKDAPASPAPRTSGADSAATRALSTMRVCVAKSATRYAIFRIGGTRRANGAEGSAMIFSSAGSQAYAIKVGDAIPMPHCAM
eukprot:3842221-Pleurochrysis_carterae.AAC.1